MARKFFPSLLNVVGRPCLVAGSGDEAEEKAVRLSHAGAHVTLLAPDISASFLPRAEKLKIKIEARDFHLEDVDCQFLVITALKQNRKTTEELAAHCRQKRVLLCVIDQPEFCDIVNVSVFERGPLRIMISTSGVAPALGKKIRLGLEKGLESLPLEAYLKELEEVRKRYEIEIPDKEMRKKKLIEKVSGFEFQVSAKLPKNVDRT